MNDYNRFVGIPWECGKSSYQAADCWGIVVMIYNEIYNVKLSHFNPDDIDTTNKTCDMISEVKTESKLWKQQSIPTEGDVVVMIGRSTGRPEHVGIYIGSGCVLHSMDRTGGQSEVHRIGILKRLFKRLEFYKYAI